MDTPITDIIACRRDSWTIRRLTTLNRSVALSSMALGALSGMLMGLWSFGGPVPAPEGLGDYAELSRRLLRLGHIAFFGLAFVNLILTRQIPCLPLSLKAQRGALGCINFGNIALPATLIAATIWQPLKYLTVPPAFAVTLALCIAAWGGWADYAGIGAPEKEPGQCP
jgi:hypothetical protein